MAAPPVEVEQIASCLGLYVVDVEGDEDRMGESPAAGSLWAHPSACGEDESSEVLVGAAVVDGACPPADWVGNVVVSADQAGSVDVEDLVSGMGVEVRREVDLEAPPLLSCLLPGAAFGDGDSVPRQKQGCREVVPECVSGEVRRVECVPAEVAPQAAEPGEGRAGVAPGADRFAIAGLDPYVGSIEYRLLVDLREAVKDGALVRQLHPHTHLGHPVSGKTRAEETAESSVGGQGGHGPPSLEAAVGGEDLVEQPGCFWCSLVHVCAPVGTVVTTLESLWTLAPETIPPTGFCLTSSIKIDFINQGQKCLTKGIPMPVSGPAAGSAAPVSAALAALRAAGESGDADVVADMLAPNVVFHSPMTMRLRFEGKQEVVALHRDIFAVLDDLTTSEPIAVGDTGSFSFRARVHGVELEAMNLVRCNEQGQIVDYTVFVRALSGLATLFAALPPRVSARRRGRLKGTLAATLARPLAFAIRTADRFVPTFL